MEIKEILKSLNEWIDDSLPNGDKEEIFNPKRGDLVLVNGKNYGIKSFYGIMGLNVNESVQVTRICDLDGDLLTGDYNIDKSDLYDGREDFRELIYKLENNLETLKNYI